MFAATGKEHRVKLAYAIVPLLWFSLGAMAKAQSSEQSPPSVQNSEQSQATLQTPALAVRSNLVLVPALVKNKNGEIVFSLTADDFLLTDNGVPQALSLEADTDSQPLALAVIVQTGGLGAAHLRDYRDLGPVLDAVIGGVPHLVGVIGFDSASRLEQDFTPDTDAAAKTIASLHEGDPGAAILDALNFGINVLRKQPPEYRRAILLISETIDGGSQTSFQEALREVDDTNTSIYSFG